MDRRRIAPQLRGLTVGGFTAAVSVAAHTAAGGALPPLSVFFLLALTCAAVGAVAAVPRLGSRAGVGAVLAAGQLAGHGVLALGCAHTAAAAHHSAGMLAAHIVAIGVAAALIHAAEHGFTALGATITGIVRLLIAPLPVRLIPPAMPRSTPIGVGPGVLCVARGGTRGPPRWMAGAACTAPAT
ncbi:hypothetical protein ONR57_04410 [Hoyosella sp. YIM 151337]|uniref:hypothetical protein n=1 Tax=Hoyosella sp. YIM 151337 TaxID=2992742 RepID=UPI0022356E36|nr:hypothetical protein [Hoyosella sp. YIM 151337]MCW4352544.1 hypothetical protein [Hoyosella sp. YIM 151337]